MRASLMTRFPVSAAIALVTLTSACSSMLRSAGNDLATGMVQATQSEIKGSGESGPLAQRTAGDIIQGSLDEAAKTERLAELQLVATNAAAAALKGMANATAFEHQSAVGLVSDEMITGAVRAFSRELDAGPLARSMNASTEQFAAAIVRGIRSEVRGVFPQCTGKDRQSCLEDRVMDLARAASVGMKEGLSGVIALPLLALAFIVGAIAAALITWGLMHHRIRRLAE